MQKVRLNKQNPTLQLSYKICNQLHCFYKSSETELRRFTLQFLPILIYIYLNSVNQGDKKGGRNIETLLIVMYNIEISNDTDGKSKVISFRMPVLAQASIYHEEKSLHQTDLRRWEENSKKTINWGPLPHVEHLNAQNRLKVMTALMFIYNQQLCQIQKSALYHFCRTTSQLVNQGFSKVERSHRSSYGGDYHNNLDNISKALPRIPISSQFLLELTHAVYFAMFNEFASVAIQTLKDIHSRACFEMLPDVILVTNAIKNSLHANPSGQPSDGPMGISVALTPATGTVTVSKSMITNASFRAKKLPDDIPIQLSKDEKGNPINVQVQLNLNQSGILNAALSSSRTGAADSSQLVSISEELEVDPNHVQLNLGRNAPGRSSKEFSAKLHKVSFPNFKKLKDRDGKSKSGSTTSSTQSMTGSLNILNESNAKDQVVNSATNKKTILKDKLINRNSSVPTTETLDNSLDSGPPLSAKSKNISLDSGTTSNSLGNNNNMDSIFSNSFDASDSIDSSADLTSDTTLQRPSILPLDKASSHQGGGTVQVYQL